jgi:hypothetical protein
MKPINPVAIRMEFVGFDEASARGSSVTALGREELAMSSPRGR